MSWQKLVWASEPLIDPAPRPPRAADDAAQNAAADPRAAGNSDPRPPRPADDAAENVATAPGDNDAAGHNVGRPSVANL
jgi:hypothetical protein